jgi:O-antigen ligase
MSGVSTYSTNRLTSLPYSEQVWLAIGIVVILIGGIWGIGTIAIPIILTGTLFSFLLLRNFVFSLLSFVTANVLITVLSKTNAEEGSSAIAYLLGLIILGIILFWVLRIRVLEASPLNNSKESFLITVFTFWILSVSIIGILNGNNPFDTFRELLSLSPLLFLPFLYQFTIRPKSTSEHLLFIAVIILGVITVLLNIIHVRNTAIESLYTGGMSRSTIDETAACLLALIGFSMLLNVRRFVHVVLAYLLLIVSAIGIIVTLRRALWIAIAMALVFSFFLSDREEQKRAIARSFILVAVIVFVVIQFSFTNPGLRYLLIGYGQRFLSSQHLATDLSLLDRYAEWRDTWRAIMQRPILGYGFGSSFRHLSVIAGYHHWQSFTHNSYLYYCFKTGFLGAALFFALYTRFLAKGFKIMRSPKLTNQQRILVRTSVAFMVLLLIASYTDTYLEHRPALVWTGLIWGYLLKLEPHRGVTEYHSARHYI